MRRDGNRSDAYQYKFWEVCGLSDLSWEFILDGASERDEYSDARLDLLDLIKERYWAILRDHFDVEGLEMLEMLASGLSQREVGAYFGINQTSVHKRIAVRKDALRQSAANDEILVELLRQLRAEE